MTVRPRQPRSSAPSLKAFLNLFFSLSVFFNVFSFLKTARVSFKNVTTQKRPEKPLAHSQIQSSKVGHFLVFSFQD